MVSNDTIMKPPYNITSDILHLISEISQCIGEINAGMLNRQSPQLRKQNRIKTIHSSLAIEGNTLSEEQITAVLENKRVLGPEKNLREVGNAIQVYEHLRNWKASNPKDFLRAHGMLMEGLMTHPGKYRTSGVGIVKGNDVQYFAPPYENVPGLMNDLFGYLEDESELTLIKSCVFHYEMEFIHPFLDGNGRMGRLWQTLILMEEFPFFEFLPFETLIHQTQNEYYEALAKSDALGKSTPFIEYMLRVILEALKEVTRVKGQIIKDTDRLEEFIQTGIKEFSRIDYMNKFKNISSATASRDLKKGLELGLIKAIGKHNQTKYTVN